MDVSKKLLRRVLLFWCWFIGLGALMGGTWFLIDPSGKSMFGMDQALASFQVLPFSDILFQNFTFPGIALILVNGVTQLATAVLLHKNRPVAVQLGAACGILLMLWICIQFVIFEFNFMSTAYFVFGLLEMLTAILLHRKESRA